MSRQDIFTLMKNKFDIYKEVNKIILLFSINLIEYHDSYTVSTNYTIEEFVDEMLFKSWKQRGFYFNCDEIKQDLGIKFKYTKEDSFDDCIKLLEYYNNLIYLVVKKYNIYQQSDCDVKDDFYILMENMKKLLDYINHDIHVNEKEEKVLLIPKNPVATAVAEISSEETALAILMYNHLSLKGDLEQKRNLLNSIYREYEPLFTSSLEGYNDFLNKTNALFNNLHIRHNNKTKKDNKNTIINLDEKELEKWYDELYQLMLFCVLIKDNLERKSNVDEFLKTIKGTKGKAEELI